MSYWLQPAKCMKESVSAVVAHLLLREFGKSFTYSFFLYSYVIVVSSLYLLRLIHYEK